jgi:hypothetical protein
MSDTIPCPCCPDGYVWNRNGPTSQTCPICGGTAELNRDGSRTNAPADDEWRPEYEY